MFVNRVMRKIFESEGGEIMKGRKKLHSEEVHNLYSPPNSSRMLKSRRISWTKNIVCMIEMKNEYCISGEKYELD
jgi:hypothetical protein